MYKQIESLEFVLGNTLINIWTFSKIVVSNILDLNVIDGNGRTSRLLKFLAKKKVQTIAPFP
jgi:hypothetical protein